MILVGFSCTSHLIYVLHSLLAICRIATRNLFHGLLDLSLYNQRSAKLRLLKVQRSKTATDLPCKGSFSQRVKQHHFSREPFPASKPCLDELWMGYLQIILLIIDSVHSNCKANV
ncbi:hypothetical protein Nepgr_008677 [Nepenthes gracilis]|uniref:Uncharacterized protein n=1 Tax=Nepenthes gracilis TaxID=150966 RepID=A0AAD3XJG5_NEPGR|nr:hypothetical protein Nepgr_008677 [Nepenthes gracilis]